MRTILDCVGEWSAVSCVRCGRPVDVLRPDGLLLMDAVITLPSVESDICAECSLAAVPKETLGNRLRHLSRRRTARRELQIPAPVTLLCLDMEIPDAKPWAGYRAELYALEGSGLEPDPGELATWPLHRSAGPRDGLPGVSIVFVGADIRHQGVPDCFLKFRIDWHRPERPFRLEVAGWDSEGLTAEGERLLLAGRRFFLAGIARHVGRPPGSRGRTRHDWIDAFRKQATTLGRAPKQDEFVRFVGTDRKTLRDNLTEYDLWPWSRFVATASAARTVTRR